MMASLSRAALALSLLLACGDDGTTGGAPSGGGGAGGAPSGGSPATGGGGATSGGAPEGGGGLSAGGSGGEGGLGGQGGGGGFGGAGGAGGFGGAGGAGGAGGGGGGGGGGVQGNCAPDSGPAELVVSGAPGKLLLRGCIVTPSDSFDGEVLIESDLITCVAADCSQQPGAMTASVVETHGIVLPGMIDAHNHILFDIFDETHWAPLMAYDNHNQWTNEARYGAMVDAKQYLNGEGTPNLDPGFGCEMNKYGELKGLIAGTTSIVGAANPTNKTCYGSLARTIDQSPNDLGADKMQVSTLFPPSSPNNICANIQADSTDAFVVHCGEGVDATSLNELSTLGTITTPDECLFVPETAIVHGTAFGDAQFDIMASSGMSLVWSPRSNVALYGAGTDLTKTTNIPLALSKGINIALGPDWSMGGSQNLLDELRFADEVDNTIWGDLLSAKDLVTMATLNGAKALHLDAVLGSIEVGKKADLFVIGGDTEFPWDAVLAATPAEVRLVVVGGVPLYGDPALTALGPAAPGCETLDACGTQKFVCVAEAGGNATNKFGQTLAEITSTLNSELAIYDALDLSPWDFAPITPLVRCP